MYHLDYSEWKLLDFKIYEEVGRINRAENRLHFELEYMWSSVCWRSQSTDWKNREKYVFQGIRLK